MMDDGTGKQWTWARSKPTTRARRGRAPLVSSLDGQAGGQEGGAGRGEAATRAAQGPGMHADRVP